MTAYLTEEQFLARLESAKDIEAITALNKLVHEFEATAVEYSDFARQTRYSSWKVLVAEKGITIQAQPVEIPQDVESPVEDGEPEPGGFVPPHVAEAIEESKE